MRDGLQQLAGNEVACEEQGHLCWAIPAVVAGAEQSAIYATYALDVPGHVDGQHLVWIEGAHRREVADPIQVVPVKLDLLGDDVAFAGDSVSA